MLVAAAGGSTASGMWGELLSTAAANRGCRGALVDGAVRDVVKMNALGFTVYARGTCPRDSLHRQRVVAVDVAVEIGGVTIGPGELLLADDDGVVVVPREVEAEALGRPGKSRGGKRGPRRDPRGPGSQLKPFENMESCKCASASSACNTNRTRFSRAAPPGRISSAACCCSGTAIRDEFARAHHEVGGFFQGLDEEGLEAVPIFFAWALPSGAVTARGRSTNSWPGYSKSLKQAGELDGVLVAPHGAAVAENRPDMDGYWLRELRSRVGPVMPIVGTLDLHANLTELMVRGTDALIGYPHEPAPRPARARARGCPADGADVARQGAADAGRRLSAAGDEYRAAEHQRPALP